MKRSLGVISSLFCSLIVFTEPALSTGITIELETKVDIGAIAHQIPSFVSADSYISGIDSESVIFEDINGDGYVTSIDLIDLLAAYGQTCTP